jgi:hypothetical protein
MLLKKRICIYNTIIKSITTCGCDIRQRKEKMLKITGFGNGAEQQHLQEKTLQIK